jgi:hypothetical protein
MNRTSLRISIAVLLFSLGTSVAAQTPAPAPAAPRAHAAPRAMHAPNGYQSRLEQLLREARDKRERVVLRTFGEEVAGQVVDIGPDWVVLSNQEGQQILLQTYTVERAEIR